MHIASYYNLKEAMRYMAPTSKEGVDVQDDVSATQFFVPHMHYVLCNRLVEFSSLCSQARIPLPLLPLLLLCSYISRPSILSYHVHVYIYIYIYIYIYKLMQQKGQLQVL